MKQATKEFFGIRDQFLKEEKERIEKLCQCIKEKGNE